VRGVARKVKSAKHRSLSAPKEMNVFIEGVIDGYNEKEEFS